MLRVAGLAPGDAAASPGALSPGAVQIIAITGTAGVGKTTLAIRFARQASKRFPDGVSLYVNLRGFDPSGSATSPWMMPCATSWMP